MPFSVVTVGTIRTRPVKSGAVAARPADLVSQHGVRFLLGQEVLGLGAAAQQSAWVPLGTLTSVAFSLWNPAPRSEWIATRKGAFPS